MSEELTLLKERAAQMGIQHSPNIGVEALKAKINAALQNDTPTEAETPAVDDTPDVPPVDHAVEKPTNPIAAKAQLRKKQRDEQMRLVRCRIVNLNPAKKDLRGEIFTVANAILGSVRKYIPYGEESENGYHIPFILYNELKDRKFVSVKTRKAKSGRMVIEQRMASEFAIEILEPLTRKELDQLARQQAAAAGLDEDA